MDHLDLDLNRNDRAVVLFAALAHDLGHGPFSHSFENLLQGEWDNFSFDAVVSNHEAWSQKIIANDPELRSLAAEQSSDFAERVISLLDGSLVLITEGEAKRVDLGSIITSQFDADRSDYMLRDSLATGVKYGIADMNWLLRNFQAMNTPDDSSVEKKGRKPPETMRPVLNLRRAKGALQAWLIGLFHLYENVYFHKTVLKYEGVLRGFLKRYVDLLVDKQSPLSIDTPKGFAQIANAIDRKESDAKSLDVEGYLSLDDYVIYGLLRAAVDIPTSDVVLKHLARVFLGREHISSYSLTDLAKKDPSAVGEFQKEVERVVGAENQKYYCQTLNANRALYKSDEKKQIWVINDEADSKPWKFKESAFKYFEDPLSKLIADGSKQQEEQILVVVQTERKTLDRKFTKLMGSRK